MAEDQAVVFGMNDAARIGRVVTWHEHSNIIGTRTPRKQQQPSTGMPPRCGILTSAMSAASPDGKTGATTFTFKWWRDDYTDTHDPKYLVEETEETVGVNRSQMSASAGKFVIVMRVAGDWLPVYVDC